VEQPERELVRKRIKPDLLLHAEASARTICEGADRQSAMTSS
jgi:hypothetical protein